MTVVNRPLHAGEDRPDGDDASEAPRAELRVVESAERRDDEHLDEASRPAEDPGEPGPVILPPEPRGMRIRRVRITSVAKLASVFFVLGYLVTMGTLVALWNVGQRLGFVTDFEELVETSLGLESFDVTGADLFELAGVSLGIVFAIGLVATVLLAIVYNAACTLLGGLAVETAPLRRPRKVFSLRHRRFIDVR